MGAEKDGRERKEVAGKAGENDLLQGEGPQWCPPPSPPPLSIPPPSPPPLSIPPPSPPPLSIPSPFPTYSPPTPHLPPPGLTSRG
ncbi:unnamed protein product [Closterium sp. NIES-53]